MDKILIESFPGTMYMAATQIKNNEIAGFTDEEAKTTAINNLTDIYSTLRAQRLKDICKMEELFEQFTCLAEKTGLHQKYLHRDAHHGRDFLESIEELLHRMRYSIQEWGRV